MNTWEFWIDVGGTFTDCIARSPDGRLQTAKVLSSGVTKGRVDRLENGGRFHDESRCGEPDGFWNGYRIRFLALQGDVIGESTVRHFDGTTGTLECETVPEEVPAGTAYELDSGEEAPILAVRTILGLRLDEPIPPCIVKLGTTRGTNALLERKGARTAFITTAGFADVLLIANQDRPRLFDLAIEKPEPIFERVVEIDERLDAKGNVLRVPAESRVRQQLTELKTTGVESIGICLLHSFANPQHEQIVERIAREIGFEEISVSSKLSPLIKIVSRGDTTVMDAYLNPILREYVGTIRASLGIADSAIRNPQSAMQSAIKMMTSAGGLVDADNFVGKDSILSGPAGGVIGFSRAAQRAGFEKSIGFDMGGTSTDVARFDGQYEMEYETKKAGVRVVAPMLAIETVAAGGGSICGFDGVKLHVGPESAGAAPGPACYGRGGPLTVTDVNLFLGKILPARFPFPLDRKAVEKRLQELCDRIADSPLGKRYTPRELADGFRKIANANMVRAIRKISVAKGYDPADYALVTFGGAGAQHACAMAEALGIHDILVHPFAGILSAYGIGQADVRRFGEQAVLKTYSPETLNDLESIFENLERETVEQVLAENVPDDRIAPPVRSLDLRYHGVETVINVTQPTDGDFARQYNEMHRQLYGYVHEDRPLEIVSARVEVVGEMPTPAEPAVSIRERTPKPTETAQCWFHGEEHATAVFLRDQLQPGDRITGPAIVCEPTSTVVVDPGWRAVVREHGELALSMSEREGDALAATRKGALPSGSRLNETAINADPVLLEIFNNLFASIAEQMGVALQQTSVSTNVKERLDFSCAIFSPTGDLVVNAPHIPVHLGVMSETVKRIIADNPDMAPGDVFVTNDPYRGGSHLPDVTVVTPVFDETTSSNPQSAIRNPQSQLLFFTASRAHHAEIGGIVPGSMPPFSKNLAEEGVLIRNFKLVDGGRFRETELRTLLSSGPFPTRSLPDNLADISAQVAANNAGVRQLRELVERYTLPVVQAYMGHIQQAATEKMRLALREIPDGEYAFTDHLDAGQQIRVTITIRGENATVDFTGTSPPMMPPADSEPNNPQFDAALLSEDSESRLNGTNVANPQSAHGAPVPTGHPQSLNLNANRAIVTAAVLYVFRCLIAEDIPLNSGVLEPVRIELPECLLNPPEREDPAECAAVVGGNVETSQRVVDCLLGALQVAAASQGTMNNLTFGDDSFGYYETICGGAGATPDADGADAVHTHMTNTRLTDVEVIERRYPVRIRRFAIRRGSGGKVGVQASACSDVRPTAEDPTTGGLKAELQENAHRGGDGIIREIEFLKPLKVSMLSERRGPYPPFGLQDGEPGSLGRNILTASREHRPASRERQPASRERQPASRERQPASRERQRPEDLGGKFAIDVQPGDVLLIETPGGGAYGAKLRRC